MDFIDHEIKGVPIFVYLVEQLNENFLHQQTTVLPDDININWRTRNNNFEKIAATINYAGIRQIVTAKKRTISVNIISSLIEYTIEMILELWTLS